MTLYAHSARGTHPAQTYSEHIIGVMDVATSNVRSLSPFVGEQRTETYAHIVDNAAEYHDMGKLNGNNQEVLSGRRQAIRLPLEHRDAGVAFLLGEEMEHPSATLVYAHHRPGLPNLMEERIKSSPFRFPEAWEDSQAHLHRYVQLHDEALNKIPGENLSPICGTFGSHDPIKPASPKLSALTYRILLSCLVDADYSDSSGEHRICPETRWSERSNRLDQYVERLQKQATNSDSIRNQLRRELYDSCRRAPVREPLVYCDSPVGTGKTTALMSHMLKSAAAHSLRHIVVVLPYTNLISQTVKVLREALVLEGENPEEIVAEHHHQADFESAALRRLATTWTAPIIVTTAVQFYETLAAQAPSKLRKLHQLPGSGIIIDESHAMLPLQLMTSAWHWMIELSRDWGCRICLSSATSFKFWENPAFQKISDMHPVPLLPQEMADRLNHFEKNRIDLNVWRQQVPHFAGVSQLVDHLRTYSGPRLVVLNTVRSAAYLAKRMKDDGYDVLHLSTALTPSDREKIIAEVERRLSAETDSNCDRDWTLVATSCIECGMNFSFRHGFCELRSLASYLQLGGRISRNGEYEESTLNTFTIVQEGFGYNPAFEISKEVFREQIQSGNLSVAAYTQSVTQAFDMECKKLGGLSDEIYKLNRKRAFTDVANRFKVIPEESVAVVADRELASKLATGQEVTAKDLQKGSVQMRRSLVRELGSADDELPVLTAEQYDGFLGYMKSLV